jgi:hypothetical protein
MAASEPAHIPATLIPIGIIIVGGDALALGTARELCAAADHDVAVLWPENAEFAAAVEGVGARFVAGRPESHEGLVRAGVH